MSISSHPFASDTPTEDSPESFVRERLAALRAADGHRTLKAPRGVDLSSNDYLGLSRHPAVIKGIFEAVEKYGAGSGGSRLLGGNLPLHEEVEETLSRFKGREAALLFNSGYQGNVGILSALAGPGDQVFSDKLNHASIVDGVRLSKARVFSYRHCDMNDLEGDLKRHPPRSPSAKRLIVTDTVFSMDGDVAPLKDLVFLAKRYGAMLMVDEAHATGVFGPGGAGISEMLGVSGDVTLALGTCGKAMGIFGAYVVCHSDMRDYLINHARSFIFSTSLPPAVLGGILAAVEVIKKEPERRERLLERAAGVREKLRVAGIDTLKSESQIVPVILGSESRALEFSRKLAEENFDVRAARPPTVPRGTSRLRLSLNISVPEEDLRRAVETIIRLYKEGV
jgi:8-amino-7-oxononanoate synthase